MRYHNVNGSRIAVHASMDYLFRPKAFEHYCLYHYFSEVQSMPRKLGKKQEYFEFLESHPLHEPNVVCYRMRSCVPVFCWNWIGSTETFTSSLLNPIDRQSSDFKDKEEYAYRFMLLFMPFRDFGDFQIDGCFQLKWQQTHKEEGFSGEMITIADNIQTIRNSLESSIPTNLLASETELYADNNDHENDADDPEFDDDFLNAIGELFATSTGHAFLTEEASQINPTFTGKVFTAAQFHLAVTVEASAWDMHSVLQFAADPEQVIGRGTEHVEHTQRFLTGTRELNSLSMHQLFRVNDNENVSNIALNATGTWQSIVMWGINAGLDDDQQCAFEILVANYVLSFSEDAKQNDNENATAFHDRVQTLCQLGRRNVNSSVPLCMFVTGPAGAGKCKCFASETTRILDTAHCFLFHALKPNYLPKLLPTPDNLVRISDTCFPTQRFALQQ
jgi:hypothetical protein